MSKLTLKILAGTSMIFAAAHIGQSHTAEAGQRAWQFNPAMLKALQSKRHGNRRVDRPRRNDWVKNPSKAHTAHRRNERKSRSVRRRVPKMDWAKNPSRANRAHKRNGRKFRNVRRRVPKMDWAKNRNRSVKSQKSAKTLEAMRNNLQIEKRLRFTRNNPGARARTSGAPSRTPKPGFWKGVSDKIKVMQDNENARTGTTRNASRTVPNSKIMDALNNVYGKPLTPVLPVKPNAIDYYSSYKNNIGNRRKLYEFAGRGNENKAPINVTGIVPGRFGPAFTDLPKWIRDGRGNTSNGENPNGSRSEPERDPATGDDSGHSRDSGSSRAREMFQDFMDGVIVGSQYLGGNDGAGYADTYEDTGYVPRKSIRKTYTAPNPHKERHTHIRDKIIKRHATPVCGRPPEGIFEDGLRMIVWTNRGGWNDIEVQIDLTTETRTVAMATLFASDCKIHGYDVIEQSKQSNELVKKTSHYDVQGTLLGFEVALNDGQRIQHTSYLPDGTVKAVKVEKVGVTVSSVTPQRTK